MIDGNEAKLDIDVTVTVSKPDVNMLISQGEKAPKVDRSCNDAMEKDTSKIRFSEGELVFNTPITLTNTVSLEFKFQTNAGVSIVVAGISGQGVVNFKAEKEIKAEINGENLKINMAGKSLGDVQIEINSYIDTLMRTLISNHSDESKAAIKAINEGTNVTFRHAASAINTTEKLGTILADHYWKMLEKEFAKGKAKIQTVAATGVQRVTKGIGIASRLIPSSLCGMFVK